MRCIPPGIQQMPAHHTQHQHHHHHHLYNIDPNAGELIPPEPSRPQHQAAPPRTESGAGADGSRGSRREGQRGPGPETGTGAQSRTLWGMRPSSSWGRCTGG